jgi:cytochrome c oxidase subunit II
MRFRILSNVVIGAAVLGFSMADSRLAPADTAPRRIEVLAKRFEFVPDNIALRKGEPVILVLQSEDVPHGIRFRELNLETEIHRGHASELSFTPTVAGDFVGHCSRFCGSGHGSMLLTLHVRE